MDSCSGIQRSSKRGGIRTGDFDARIGASFPSVADRLIWKEGTFVRSVADWRSGVGVGDNEGEIIVALSASDAARGNDRCVAVLRGMHDNGDAATRRGGGEASSGVRFVRLIWRQSREM